MRVEYHFSYKLYKNKSFFLQIIKSLITLWKIFYDLENGPDIFIVVQGNSKPMILQPKWEIMGLTACNLLQLRASL